MKVSALAGCVLWQCSGAVGECLCAHLVSRKINNKSVPFHSRRPARPAVAFNKNLDKLKDFVQRGQRFPMEASIGSPAEPVSRPHTHCHAIKPRARASDVRSGDAADCACGWAKAPAPSPNCVRDARLHSSPLASPTLPVHVQGAVWLNTIRQAKRGTKGSMSEERAQAVEAAISAVAPHLVVTLWGESGAK